MAGTAAVMNNSMRRRASFGSCVEQKLCGQVPEELPEKRETDAMKAMGYGVQVSRLENMCCIALSPAVGAAAKG